MKTKYTEIIRLKELLDYRNIPCEFIDRNKIFDKDNLLNYNWGYQIIVYKPNTRERLISVIEGFGTYGESENLLEIWESGKEDVEGYLSCKEVFERIMEVYK